MDILDLSVYLIPLAIIVYFYLSGRNKKENAAIEQLNESIEAGLTEPPSLHPYIDPVRCLGAGAAASPPARKKLSA